MEARGVDLSSWESLREFAADEGTGPRRVAKTFVEAFEQLLALDRDIAEELVANDPQRELLEPFLEVFDKAASNSVLLLKENFSRASEDLLLEIALALRYSGLPEEIVALAAYVDASSDLVPVSDKLDRAKTATDSVKDLIKNIKWIPWWLAPVLDAINEALDIFRGGGKAKA
jgi:hypothetical protein